MTLKAQAIQENIDKLDFIKIEIFCASKDTIESEKTPHRMNIFVNRVGDKVLLPRKPKEPFRLDNKNVKNPVKKMGKGLE